MPNSGTVTAGSVALASQYNNLRSDVLDTSTGHVHSGSADAGARIEATYLKSTGATNGQVLTADGTANSVWTTLSQSGALTTASASFVFPATTGYTTTYNGPAATNLWGQFQNGTTLFCVDDTVNTSSRAARVFTHATAATSGGSITASATASLALSVAGTVRGVMVPNTWFLAGTSSASTAVYYGELVTATTSGNPSLTFKKYNLSLSSNIWTATISAATNVLATGTALIRMGAKYAPETNSWITVQAANSAVSAYVYNINDATGAISSAAFPINVMPSGYVFVPSTGGTAAGTVHVWGTSATDFVRATYATTQTTITAISTATTSAAAFAPTTYWYHSLIAGGKWNDAWWDRTEECIVVHAPTRLVDRTSTTLIGIDRSFGTVLFQSHSAGTGTFSSYNIANQWNISYLAEKPFDSVSRLAWGKTSTNSRQAAIYRIGKKGDFYSASPDAVTYSDQNSSDNDYVGRMGGFLGPGSAVDFWTASSAGQGVYQHPLSGTPIAFATVLAAASVGRMVSLDSSYPAPPVSLFIIAEDAFSMNSDAFGGYGGGTAASANPFSNARFPLYLPANKPLVLGFASQDNPAANNNGAGTVTVGVKAINLA